jgi:hypothetical protein
MTTASIQTSEIVCMENSSYFFSFLFLFKLKDFAIFIDCLILSGTVPKEGEGVDSQLRQDLPGAEDQQRHSDYQVRDIQG